MGIGPYRKCPNHGWLHIQEYTVDEAGETICPICVVATHGFYPEGYPNWQGVGGPTHPPREEFVQAAREYNRAHHD